MCASFVSGRFPRPWWRIVRSPSTCPVPCRFGSFLLNCIEIYSTRTFFMIKQWELHTTHLPTLQRIPQQRTPLSVELDLISLMSQYSSKYFLRSILSSPWSPFSQVPTTKMVPRTVLVPVTVMQTQVITETESRTIQVLCKHLWNTKYYQIYLHILFNVRQCNMQMHLTGVHRRHLMWSLDLLIMEFDLHVCYWTDNTKRFVWVIPCMHAWSIKMCRSRSRDHVF